MPLYSPLPTGSVRLLRLSPPSDEDSGIKCQLVTCSLLDSGRTHPYEALSYVWGSENNKQSIYVGDHELPVGVNLYKALSHLRDCFVDRYLWIDAICINQNDKDEKGQQVQSMAKIFAKASRVIVWLGEAADNSNQALEVIRMAAEEQHTNSTIYKTNRQAPSNQHPTNSAINETNQQAVLRLLERPWFQRIWVSGRQPTMWEEVIDIVYSGPSRGCRGSTYPDEVWSHGDRRICILLRHKHIETL